MGGGLGTKELGIPTQRRLLGNWEGAESEDRPQPPVMSQRTFSSRPQNRPGVCM